MYAPGTCRHIKGALNAGATPEEIMSVLHLCVSMAFKPLPRACRFSRKSWSAPGEINCWSSLARKTDGPVQEQL
jgi:hypothetical protein